jgi:hypothetical protein
MRALALILTVLALPACSAIGQPAMTVSKETAPYPDNYTRIVLDYFSVVGPAIAPGSQLSEPRTTPAAAFEPRAWYSCLRQPAPPPRPPEAGEPLADISQPRSPWVDTVLMYRQGRIQGQIPGPAPHFCDGPTYKPLPV